MIAKERHGEVVNRVAIRNICHMLIVLGIGSREVYEDDFEILFLRQSSEFYKVSICCVPSIEYYTYRQRVKSFLQITVLLCTLERWDGQCFYSDVSTVSVGGS